MSVIQFTVLAHAPLHFLCADDKYSYTCFRVMYLHPPSYPQLPPGAPLPPSLKLHTKKIAARNAFIGACGKDERGSLRQSALAALCRHLGSPLLDKDAQVALAIPAVAQRGLKNTPEEVDCPAGLVQCKQVPNQGWRSGFLTSWSGKQGSPISKEIRDFPF